MGQKFSAQPKFPGDEDGYLVINESGSNISDIKLNSANTVIPISEYIKKEKYNKNKKKIEEARQRNALALASKKTNQKPSNISGNKRQSNTTNATLNRQSIFLLDDSLNNFKNHINPSNYPLRSRNIVDIKTIPLMKDENVQTKTEISIAKDSNIYFSANVSNEQSTHSIKKHNVSSKQRRHKKKRNLDMYTKLTCTIHPNLELMKKLNIGDKPKVDLNIVYNAPESSKNCLSSPKQALQHWKEIHSMKYQNSSSQHSAPKCSSDNMNCATSKKSVQTSAHNCCCKECQHHCHLEKQSTTPTKKISSHHSNHSHNLPKSESKSKTSKPTSNDNLVNKMLHKPDFLNQIEGCLKQQFSRARHNLESNENTKSTWVQDMHNKWHKITIDNL